MIRQPDNLRSAGFSLIELMVGLVIGLLATLVVLQVFSAFEGQKRTTAGTSDAQTSGNVGLYMIKRELASAGYGLNPIGVQSVPDSPLECSTIDYSDSGVTTLTPVTITDGGTGSDTITIRYGTTGDGGSFTSVANIGTAGTNIAAVNDNQACKPDDIVLMVSSQTCGLTKTAHSWNPATDTTLIQLTANPGMGTALNNNTFLSCLGQWKETTFQINPNYDPTDPNNSQAYLAQDGAPVVTGIVNIQAQYGISDTPQTNKVTHYVDAVDGTAYGNFGPGMSRSERNRIKVVRVAVVARNGLMEKSNVTDAYNGKACSSLTSDSPLGVCAWSGGSSNTIPISPAPAIDLSKDPDWRRYRYRVFETIIPLRNVIWYNQTL